VAEKNYPKTLYRGRGCRKCHQSGFKGRTGIHELMVNTDELKDLIVQRTNANTLRTVALKNGMITLRQDGWKKVGLGITTIDEVARVTAADLF
jgi:general secretion pathway protein E/type IV pilus assembly protein PilB